MEEPQEVQDEEYERVWERVAAVDVAKASGVVCTRVPDEARPGRRRTRVWTVTQRSIKPRDLNAYSGGSQGGRTRAAARLHIDVIGGKGCGRNRQAGSERLIMPNTCPHLAVRRHCA